MRKTIVAISAAAFLGGVALTPKPAAAWIPLPFMYAILKSKEDPNFKAVNPYAAKPMKRARKKK
jgi:hypothetical protein